jgi:hypothetical protein
MYNRGLNEHIIAKMHAFGIRKGRMEISTVLSEFSRRSTTATTPLGNVLSHLFRQPYWKEMESYGDLRVLELATVNKHNSIGKVKPEESEELMILIFQVIDHQKINIHHCWNMHCNCNVNAPNSI